VKSVLIADDQAMIRQTLCYLFASQQNFEVCGEAENGLEAVEMAQVLRPDPCPGSSATSVRGAARFRESHCKRRFATLEGIGSLRNDSIETEGPELKSVCAYRGGQHLSV